MPNTIDARLRGKFCHVSWAPGWLGGITQRSGKTTNKRIRLLARKLEKREIAAMKRATGLSKVKHLIERNPALDWR